MSVYDMLLADIKTAMKARDKDTLVALRSLSGEIKNVEINERREVTEADVTAVVMKAIKQRQDALEQFRKGGREDLAVVEEAQIELFKKYQPRQLDEAEVEALVRECIAESGAEGKRDMGKVMQSLMPKVNGKADGKLVSSIVGRLLN
jgi:uncharacterized protein YqeY